LVDGSNHVSQSDQLQREQVPSGVVSILNQILRPIQRFPQSLKSVRIVAFAFFLYRSIAEAAYRGTQPFDGLVPNQEGFG
jgi:hypothetical protein